MNQRTSDQSPVIDAGFNDDEIDLFDLWDDLVANKIWVGVGLFACIALAVVYLVMAKPVYEVKSVVKPASERDLVAVNAPELGGVYSLGVDAAFEHAKRALLSKEYHRNFYKQNLLEIKSLKGLYNPLLSESQNFTNFDKLLRISLSDSKKDDETFIVINFEWVDAQKAADLLNAYVDFTLQSRVSEIKRTLESKRLVRLNKLGYDASLIRDKYYSEKTQRKLKLDEALGIAKNVGQVKPIYSESNILGSFKPPLYMYGSKALAAEEFALKQRVELAKDLPHGEEHFIAGMSSILFEIKQLKELKIDYSAVKIVQLDEPALVPIRPVKPKKLLVVALSVVVGGFLGLMLALIMAAYKRHVKRT
jgi:chain length determinant protein (polysaccharide antigen chain regulator)